MTSEAHPGLPGNQQANQWLPVPKEGLCLNSTSHGMRLTWGTGPGPLGQHFPKQLTLQLRLLTIHSPHSTAPKVILILANVKGKHGRGTRVLPPASARDPVRLSVPKLFAEHRLESLILGQLVLGTCP